jgi:serine/threonine-protein kinase
MVRCFSCTAAVPDASRFCPSCGTRFQDADEMPTVLSQVLVSQARQTSPHSFGAGAITSDPSSSQRFLPGAMLAGRFRIIGLVGRGGMGEVYRADDLRLGQPVALKFLPEELERDPYRLERFFAEVRTARQISHPNVCRVHDVQEVDGHHFLSMEFVDGEDLATLLRRIGRLPEDRAVQIARQLCAGLAAAHKQGILHRDLKPANVMIDGRGGVRITDFGLAALAKDVQQGEVHAGTPGYMAPEQIEGREVSVRSDVYALGLVLYELFTGKPAFRAPTMAEMRRLQQDTMPVSPTSHLPDLDPAVERVILRCLERDPEERPASALSVAAALPGGNPLAAALAAGETPSPEMVAAAGPRGGLRAGSAWACLVAVILGIAGTMLAEGIAGWPARLPLDKSPEALVENAQRILGRLGIDNERIDSAHGFSASRECYDYLTRTSDAGLDAVAEPGQLLLSFAYRQSAQNLVPYNIAGVVTRDDPDRDPGDVSMTLDLHGRLVRMLVTPQRYEDEPGEAPVREADWSALFDSAGLAIEAFTPVEPSVRPEIFADARRAWSGTLADFADMPVRIEAASLGGLPVYFEKVVPFETYWSAETEAQGSDRSSTVEQVGEWVIIGFLFALAGGAVFLALRNLRLGRGDRRGVARLACGIAVLRMLNWLWTAEHAPDVAGETYLFLVALGGALSLALLTWVLYVALEPYVRRLWPESLVSWSRLLAGRVRDPLVGRDVLFGVTIGCSAHLLINVLVYLAEGFEILPSIPHYPFLGTLRGGRYAVGQLFQVPIVGLAVTLAYLLLFLLLRIFLRKQRIAVVAFGLVAIALQLLQFVSLSGELSFAGIAFGVAVGVFASALLLISLVRFGIVATTAMAASGNLLAVYPITSDTSAFYFGSALIGPLAIVALAAYGFRTAFNETPAEIAIESAA